MTDVRGLLLQVGPHGPHGPMDPHGPMGPGGGGGWGAMPWGAGGSGLLPALLWLVVLAAVVGGLAYLVLRRLDEREPDERGPGRSDAWTILETRYARGEIDDEEFERRRDRLVVEP